MLARVTKSLDFQKYAMANPLYPDDWVIKSQILFTLPQNNSTLKNKGFKVNVVHFLVLGVGVINEDKVIQCVTEITVEDMTVIVATNNIYQGVTAS